MVETGQSATKAQKPFDVFVSHSSKDADKARAIVEALEENGIRCWIAPRNILPGSQYGESIVEGIEKSEIMILVFSQHANSSPQITREVERAVHHGMRIIPFRIENVPPSKNLEYFISSPHWLDAYSGSFSSHLSYLNKTVLHLLGRSGTTEEPTRSGTFTVPHTASEIVPSLIKLITGLSALALTCAKKLFSLTAAVFSGVAAALAWLLSGLSKAGSGLGQIVPSIGRGLLPIVRQWKAVLFSLLLLFGGYLGYKWFTLKPLEEALIGKWQLSITGVPLVGIPTIHSDGSYEMTLAYQETGSIEIRNGWLYLVSKNGYERRVSWEPVNDSTVTAELIPDEFWNVAAKISPDRSPELAALRTKAVTWVLDSGDHAAETRRWSIVPEQDDLPWTFLFETGPGKSYKIRAVQIDKGRAGTSGTELTLTSTKMGAKSGQFSMPDEDTVQFSTQIGQMNWRRLSR